MPALSKEFLDIQETTDCGFTLKHVCDMIKHTVAVSYVFMFKLVSKFEVDFLNNVFLFKLRSIIEV